MNDEYLNPTSSESVSPSAPVEPSTYDRLLSVVVVTYNSGSVIAPALLSVQSRLPGAEIVVVDNGSTDETIEIVRQHVGVRLLTSDHNVGFGAAVNMGVRSVEAPLVLAMNPDVRILAADLSRIAQLPKKGSVGLMGCATPGSTSVAAPMWPWRFELGWALFTWFLLPKEATLTRPRARKGKAHWIGGAAFIIARDEFLGIGGFDEQIFLYYEDFDLARRYTSRGYQIDESGLIEVQHMGRSSSPRHEEFLMTCALLSLIQTTATWNRGEEARRAARLTVISLRTIEAVGYAMRSLPVVGRRARRKSCTAGSVREALSGNTGAGEWGPAYRDALTAFRSGRMRRRTASE